MGVGIDTILVHAANPGATGAAATPATGDSLAVRSFAQQSSARLETMIRQAAEKGFLQVKSPMFHDNVRGIRLLSGTGTSHWLMPPVVGQPLRPSDTLSVTISAATAASDVGALIHYYTTLPGANAQLVNWGDISGSYKSIVSVEVACNSGATIGAWVDTPITHTTNLLHANTTYAILGYQTTTTLAVVATKGQHTSNLRVGGPGTVESLTTALWFVQQGTYHGTPHIPVFTSNNRTSVYVSVGASTATVAANVSLICAELTTSLF
jgi:hypothetical protein